MNVLYTSLTIAAKVSFVAYRELIGYQLFESGTIGIHNFASYGTSNPHHYLSNGVSAICLSNSIDQKVNNVAETIANRHSVSCSGHTAMDVSAYSCIVVNSNTNTVCMISDSVGSLPLWYAFDDQMEVVPDIFERHYIITTDLMSAYHFGFNNINPLGPGQAMLVDLKTNEIQSMTHWLPLAAVSQSDSLINNKYLDPQLYSKSLFAAAMRSINQYTNSNKSSSQVFVELSSYEPSSLLLDCAADGLEVNRALRYSRPLVMSMDTVIDSPIFNSIVGNDGQLMVQPLSRIRQPSFARIAAERWQLCSAAKAGEVPLLSFDSGKQSRSIQVYFQNLFCSLLNVRVVYPFADVLVQKAIWSTSIHSGDSLFAQAVPILIGEGSCNVSSSDSANYFDLKRDSKGCIKKECIDRVISYDAHLKGQKKSTVLWQAANEHATEDGFIVLVLATSGYSDLLTNFLNSATALSNGTFHHLLVVTPDVEIVTLAHKYKVGVYVAQLPVETRVGDGNQTFADFGTLSYQRLILQRTECAMELMLLGFKPVIADVDAVWLRNPLQYLEYPTKSQPLGTSGEPLKGYDLAFTDDNGEVCGCLVVLTNTLQAIMFWRTVLQKHQELVQQASESKYGHLNEFADSEQKVLTLLLYKKHYTRSVSARLLSSKMFPTGYQYFNRHSHMISSNATAISPAIVHNNFLIGRQMKITRFQRYNFWKSKEEFARSYADTSSVNTIFRDESFPKWSQVFHGVAKNVSVPSLTIVLPLQDTEIVTSANKGERPVMIDVIREETINANSMKMSVWVESDPPNLFTFDNSALFDVFINTTNIVGSITALIQNSNIEVAVDVTYNRSHFSSLRFPHTANERVLHRIRELPSKEREVSDQVAKRINSAKLIGPNVDYKEIIGHPESDEKFTIEYTIKVISFKRAASLGRLLSSLAAANYLNYTISLDILIDAHRLEEEKELVAAVQRVAELFNWPFGPKKVILRPNNFGLANQWHSAWTPTVENEVAFIFEDDTEVSPYFFVWAHKAVRKYYSSDSSQREAHRILLDSVRAHIAANQSSSESSPMEEFNRLFAGQPILYGICLQNQHLDALRYPKKLHIQNGHRPFLYSLIGSWGPLMFPLAWRAFCEWWMWRSNYAVKHNILEPLTENLVVNQFYKKNRRNWTPWHVRFAYETGLKCLYSNLPDGYALVVNHREVGENYVTSMGASSPMVDTKTLMILSIPDSELDETTRKFNKALRWSLLHFPHMIHLDEWQYDFHLRRPGALGIDKLFSWFRKHEQDAELENALRILNDDIKWFTKAMQFIGVPHKNLSVAHWQHLIGLLEAHLMPDAQIVHFGISPLIPALSHKFLSHSLLAPSALCYDDYPRLESVVCRPTDHPASSFVSDVVILSMPFMSALIPESDTTGGRQLWNFISPPEYIMILLDICSAAPTDLKIDVVVNEVLQSIQYSVVEDVCVSGSSDVGGVLFRRIGMVGSTEADDIVHRRFAISRRYDEDLISRTFIQKIDAPTFN